MKSKRIWMGAFFVIVAILAAACSGPNRAASTPVVAPEGQPSGQNPAEVAPQPGPTDAPSQVETLMAGELATQTAIAGGQQPEDNQQPEENQPPAEATPEPAATQPPPPPAQPTAVPPTPIPEPTETEEPPPQADCSSPYTVKVGDWVWDIGRRCNIHPDSIIAANNLVWPYVIFPGDILILPTNAPPFPGP